MVSAGLRISAVLLSMALTAIVMSEVIGHSAERTRIRRLRRRVQQEGLGRRLSGPATPPALNGLRPGTMLRVSLRTRISGPRRILGAPLVALSARRRITIQKPGKRRRDGFPRPADVAHARSHRLPGLRHTRGV